jgi:hypothetical protein
MDGISSRLEEFHYHRWEGQRDDFSFQDISKMTKLKSLSLHNMKELKQEEFHLLSNCQNLESIEISQKDFQFNLHQHLSSILPNLKHILIHNSTLGMST